MRERVAVIGEANKSEQGHFTGLAELAGVSKRALGPAPCQNSDTSSQFNEWTVVKTGITSRLHRSHMSGEGGMSRSRAQLTGW